MQGFGYYLKGVSSVAVYGGNDGNRYDQELKSLRLGADVVIATPGRLISHISLGNVDMSKVSYFVLDEADRMLDMGFIHDIKKLIPLLPKRRQTLLFSATMPETIAKLSKSLLYKPARVEVAPVSSVVDTIEQRLYFVEKPQKTDLLVSVLKNAGNRSALVFSRTKHGADRIARKLKARHIECEAIHGNKIGRASCRERV